METNQKKKATKKCHQVTSPAPYIQIVLESARNQVHAGTSVHISKYCCNGVNQNKNVSNLQKGFFWSHFVSVGTNFSPALNRHWGAITGIMSARKVEQMFRVSELANVWNEVESLTSQVKKKDRQVGGQSEVSSQ